MDRSIPRVSQSSTHHNRTHPRVAVRYRPHLLPSFHNLSSDYLQIAIDVSGDGRLSTQPPADPNAATGLYNVTLFLTSAVTGLNLTISNGTSAGWRNGTDQPVAFSCPTATVDGTLNAGCEPVLQQESGSTVKHVNWAWPDCLVGNGAGSDTACGRAQPNAADCVVGNARGAYNISIHQSFRLNGSAYYTIFEVPIDVTNSIPNTTQRSSSGKRPLCAQLNNVLLPQDQVRLGTTPLPYQPFLGGEVGTQNIGNPTNEEGGVSGTCSRRGSSLKLMRGVFWMDY